VKTLRAAGGAEQILVGGPAVDASVARSIGADAWAADARDALREFDRIVGPVPTA
jgi:methanogenic corrinoid protein MtbC1